MSSDKRKWLNPMLAVISALLLGVSNLPGLSFVGVISFVPFFILLSIEQHLFKLVLWTSFIQILRTLISGYWIPTGIEAFSGLALLPSWMIFILLALINSFSFQASALAVCLLRKLNTNPILLMLATALTLIVGEKLLPTLIPIPLLVPYLLSNFPAMQLLDILPPASLSFAMLLPQIGLALLITGTQSQLIKPRIFAAISFSLLLLLNCAGLIRLSQIQANLEQARTENHRTQSLQLVLVQPAIANTLKKNSHEDPYSSQILDQTLAHSQKAFDQTKLNHQNPTLLIWPETAVPAILDAPYLGGDLQVKLRNFIRQTAPPMHLISGGYSRDRGSLTRFNSAFSLSSETTISTVRKAKLFPIGETVPFSETFPILKKWFPSFDRLKKGKSGVLKVPLPYAASNLQELRPQNEVKLGIAICFELAFELHVKALIDQGAEAILQLSNESWFESSVPAEQMLAMAKWWAIQYRRPVIRVDNANLSSVLDETGKITAQLPANSSGFLKAQIQFRSSPRPHPIFSSQMAASK